MLALETEFHVRKLVGSALADQAGLASGLPSHPARSRRRPYSNRDRNDSAGETGSCPKVRLTVVGFFADRVHSKCCRFESDAAKIHSPVLIVSRSSVLLPAHDLLYTVQIYFGHLNVVIGLRSTKSFESGLAGTSGSFKLRLVRLTLPERLESDARAVLRHGPIEGFFLACEQATTLAQPSSRRDRAGMRPLPRSAETSPGNPCPGAFSC